MSISSDSFDLCLEEPENHDDYIANLEEVEENRRQYNTSRPIKFETYVEDNKDDPESIFNLPGIRFISYSHKSIKFCFQPSLVVEMVSPRLMFIVSLKYRMGYWMVKKDLVPVNCKWRLYKLFYTTISCTSHFRFTDENVHYGIREIWELLCNWAANDDLFRREKRQRYINGEDLYLDEDDEELFLSPAEVHALHRRRSAVWKRMLPPPSNEEMPARRRRRN